MYAMGTFASHTTLFLKTTIRSYIRFKSKFSEIVPIMQQCIEILYRQQQKQQPATLQGVSNKSSSGAVLNEIYQRNSVKLGPTLYSLTFISTKTVMLY